MDSNLRDILDIVEKKVPQQPQVQNALGDQLILLRVVADRLGLYDAADYLRYKNENK